MMRGVNFYPDEYTALIVRECRSLLIVQGRSLSEVANDLSERYQGMIFYRNIANASLSDIEERILICPIWNEMGQRQFCLAYFELPGSVACSTFTHSPRRIWKASKSRATLVLGKMACASASTSRSR
jgi:hypothetical protein